jgi:hypothetical protein
VESVAVIPGTEEDEVWVSVKRYVNSATDRYIERLSVGLDSNDSQELAFYVDSGLSLNSPINISAATSANPVVITTSSSHGLSDGEYVDIRDVAGMTELNGNRYLVSNSTSTTFELQTLAGVDVDGSGYSSYISGGTVRGAVTTISGLSHLEGETVQILGNGAVQASQTVSSGSITLPTRASIVHVGLGYTSELETQRLEGGSADGISQGKIRRIHEVILRLYRSLGGEIGRVDGNIDQPPFRDSSDAMNAAPALFTGDLRVDFSEGYDRKGTIYLRQQQPLPYTILGMFAHMKVNG